MKVVEKFMAGKTNTLETCEDGMYVSDDFLSVIDGATSTSKETYDGKTTGQLAKDIILQTLPSLPKTISGQEAIEMLDQAIAAWYKKNNIYEYMQDHPSERCIASLVIYSNYYRQLWMVGDCQALVDGRLITNNKFVDELFANVRSFYLETELLKGKTIENLIEQDTGREFVLPLIIKQTLFQNTDNQTFGFFVLDGFFKQADPVKIISITQDAHELVLASDGYPALRQTLSETETLLKNILQEDPLCFRKNKQVKAFKKGAASFDDRIYLRAEI